MLSALRKIYTIINLYIGHYVKIYKMNPALCCIKPMKKLKKATVNERETNKPRPICKLKTLKLKMSIAIIALQ